ncbi:hypothetical protein GCM10008905_28390 [Clostridium malenominatum]|uniref:Helix-turn-helix domain-containing protein n=1 Tax=Clostridium malenominatum TaxID=1539 RepID=A0ABP3UB42_9CLOT
MKDVKEKVIYCLLGFSILLNIYTINLISNFKVTIANELYRLNADVNRVNNRISSIDSSFSGIRAKVDKYITKEEMGKDFMSVAELAEYLDINRNVVYIMMENKELDMPYVKIDSEYRFSKAAIGKWLSTRKIIDNYK